MGDEKAPWHGDRDAARLNSDLVLDLARSMGIPTTPERFGPVDGSRLLAFAWTGLPHRDDGNEWVACAYLAESTAEGLVTGLKPGKMFLHGQLETAASVHKAAAAAVPALLERIDRDIPVVVIVPSQACLQHHAKLLEAGRKPKSKRAGSIDWISFDQQIEGRDVFLIHAFDPMSEVLAP